jgi:hypothetical protein
VHVLQRQSLLPLLPRLLSPLIYPHLPLLQVLLLLQAGVQHCGLGGRAQGGCSHQLWECKAGQGALVTAGLLLLQLQLLYLEVLLLYLELLLL